MSQSVFTPQTPATPDVPEPVRQQVIGSYAHHGVRAAELHMDARTRAERIHSILGEIAALQEEIENRQRTVDALRETVSKEEVMRRDQEQAGRQEQRIADGWALIARQNHWDLPALPPTGEAPQAWADTHGDGSAA
ncbi:hypothetical protein ABZ470_39855 [Streptosporangium sp. NPDC020072]|uniref:hypothetical protein n=1 Tax=Streptosporangium sp. NPDC020072 TaxID=3154788 RepID=UPI00344A54E5